jgi:hypothetical protein
MAHYRLTAKGTLPGESFNFGLHATGSAGDSAGAATALAAALTSMWTDATDGLVSHYTSDVVIVAGHAAELSDLTGKQVDAADSSLSLTGTAVSQMLPHEVCPVISTRAAAAQRKDRGRFYLPPPAITTCVAGLLDSTVRGHFANAAAILVNSLQGAGFTPVILHHVTHTDDAITVVRAGSVFGVQRRRRNDLIEAYTDVGV